MKRTICFLNTLLVSIFAVTIVTAQTTTRSDGMRFVPDVPAQFFNLTTMADPLGFNITTTPDPSACRHYQGMHRAEGSDGTPFFIVTRSGNTPSLPGPDELLCDDSPGETRNGNLIVFRMDSRDKNGERLRSNRLKKGVHVDSTAPIASLDRATIYFTPIGGDPNDPDPAKRPGLVLREGENDLPPRVYQHPGGMQAVGNILAVALESPRQFGKKIDLILCNQDPPDTAACDRYYGYERAQSETAVHFYDISDPEEPKFRSQFIPRNSAGENISKVGVVAITPLPNGRYLMVISGGEHNHTWFFYRSTVNDLSSPNLSWEQVRSPLGPVTEDAHQTLNFLREGNIEGDLYIAGARGHVEFGPFFTDRDRIDLYKIDCVTKNCEPGEDITVTTRFQGKFISPFPSTNGTQLASLAAASTFYVSPLGELIFYATEHDNDGPGETVKVGEWRHAEVARPGSPTFLPSANLDGPFEVNEGSSINLTGTGEQAATKAFVQLITAPIGLYLTASYEDRDRDDFDDLFAYEPSILGRFGDSGVAWRWFAPEGCSIQAIDRKDGNVDEVKTLTNVTSVQTELLSDVLNDAGTENMDREIDKITFGSDCDAYYSAPVNLFWDLDRDGTYESQGTSMSFAGQEGPATIEIPVEARHSLGGAPGKRNAVVIVKNVAPQLSQFSFVDSGGNPINSTVPWVLTGVPVTVASNFGDPGLLDHQTAQISWGDGTTDANAAFNAFDEAFGDGVGSLSHSHVFTNPGTYTVQTTVTDDDADSDVESANVRVLTPEQAVLELIAMIDGVIASTTDQQVLSQLQKARRALTGTNANSQDGALNMIRAGENEAAAAFALDSVSWLERAAENGADVAVPIALLKQVAAALRT